MLPVDVISVLRRCLVDVLDWLFALLECSAGQSESLSKLIRVSEYWMHLLQINQN